MGGRRDAAFTKIGFRNWKKANERFKKHAKSANHMSSMQLWLQLRVDASKKVNLGVDHLLHNAEEDEIKSNRYYIKSIMKVILTLCRQNIPLRGHNESQTSSNRGNFREILDLVEGQDHFLQKKIGSLYKNATYLPPMMQNCIVMILGKMVKDKICEEVMESQAFTLLADETKDVSKTEQLSIVIRYVKAGQVCERFFGFVAFSDLTATGIAESIVSALSKEHIDLAMCVSQCFDGASVMSGTSGGVQAKIRDLCLMPFIVTVTLIDST